MRRFVLFVVLSMVGVSVSWANPTGAPLSYFPVEPCRFLDTRASQPIPPNLGVDVFVRGSALQASSGAKRADCKVPPEAEAVTIVMTGIAPTANGYLKANGTGWTADPQGPYSSFVYRIGESETVTLTISLCNVFLFPTSHQPCAYDGSRYADFQIVNFAAPGSSIHVAADVVGYFKYVE